MQLIQTLLLILAGCLPCQAGETPGTNLPPIAVQEMERRGNVVRELGGIQASEADAIIEALAPPASDADKWYVTLVTTTPCAPCERLKFDIKNSPVLKAWVNVDSPKDSQVHYQARSVTDPTQAAWLASLKDRLEAGGFPAIVIQPPRSGEYGKAETVVGMIHGYDGNPKTLVASLSNKVKAYVKELHRKGLITHKSRPVESYESIGAPPPFVVDDEKNNPYVPSGPNDWPPPQMLTLAQVQEAVPEADSDFVLAQLKVQEVTGKPLTAEGVRQCWADMQPQPIPETDPNFQPAQPILSGGVTLLIVLGVIVAIGYGLYRFRNQPKKTAKKKPTKSVSTAPTVRTR